MPKSMHGGLEGFAANTFSQTADGTDFIFSETSVTGSDYVNQVVPIRRFWSGLTVATAMSLALTAADASTGNRGIAETPRILQRLPITTVAAARYNNLYREMTSYRGLRAGWDGPDSVAPSQAAIDEALDFLALLPDEVKLPETSVSGDGEVGFFWSEANAYIDVGFRGNGRLVYYGKAGDLEARDVIPFDGESLPQDLLSVIRRA